MNHIYRVVWSEVARAWVAVAEFVKSHRKAAHAESGAGISQRLLATGLKGMAASLAMIGHAHALDANALPTGGKVTAGSATISQSGSTLNINQSSQRVALDWQTFNIGAAATVNFLQPSSSAVALNRILSDGASEIYGKLNANGQVFFTNPNGMLFARGAQVNVGGILATTLNISNSDFMAGNYTFSNPGSGSIRNEGLINAVNSVALVGNTVQNAGQIVATNVTLAAGNTVAVDLTGDGLIRARVTDPGLKARIENSGSIDAKLAVTMTAGQAKGTLDQVVNNSGVIKATGLALQGGDVVLEGGLIANTGTLSADTAIGDGGHVTLSGTNIAQDGRISATSNTGAGGRIDIQAERRLIQTDASSIDASGVTLGGSITVSTGQADDGSGAFLSGSLVASATQGKGGDITVTGRDLYFAAARIEASGATDGGQVRLGGDYQGKNTDIPNAWTNYLNGTTTILANGTSGNGGRVIVWSDSQTTFGGTIEAKGAMPYTGGFVEVSGKDQLHFAGVVAAKTLLLDPKNIVIDAAGAIANFQLVDPNPGAGNGFGSTVTEVASSNIAVTSPGDSFAASASGAAYLFNGNTGALISTLRGSLANDQVGFDGIISLSNGNYVVLSNYWNVSRGAATWGNGVTGITGTVSSTNSLVGSSAYDRVGSSAGAYQLSNGNYVVTSPFWSGNRGAVTWGNGATGITGTISSANSLVGGSVNDQVGIYGVTLLDNGNSGGNGNYVVNSPHWNGARGASTWGNGATGIVGTVSSANSLVGSSGGDNVGGSIVTLANGNYLVRSVNWSGNAGAVTWGNGATGITGFVSSTNSLVGGTPGDLIGVYATPLTNGNYLVVSSYWGGNKGSVTWGSGTAGVSGVVSSANSLVGSTAGDQVGDQYFYPRELSNGNYVVPTPYWNGNRGAITWGSGTAGVSGVISSTNSLVGSSVGDYVGRTVTELSNGNYVVWTSSWNGGMGAVTWGSGTIGVSGTVSSSNSLVGSTVGDHVGNTGVTQLANGNYVVASSNWNGTMGAVTWGSGTTGITGTINSSNSLVGSAVGDQVGFDGVAPLANGNYVVASSNWNGTMGAVTLGSGTTGIAGTINSSNSLVGSTVGDHVGTFVSSLANGNYVVASPSWNNSRGAATWGSGTTGVTGTVSSSNSLVGSTVGDQVGSLGVASTSNNGNYAVVSPLWNAQRGAVTWGSGTTGITGTVSSTNSLVGGAAGDQVGSDGVWPVANNSNYVVASSNWNGGMGAVTWGSGTSGITGTVSSSNSLVGSTAGDQVGVYGYIPPIFQLSNGNYMVSSPNWNGAMGAVTWGSGTAGVSGVISSANSLVGSTVGDQVGLATWELSNGNYIVLSPNWTSGSYAGSGRVDVMSGTGSSGGASLPQTFATTASATATLAPSTLTATLNTGTAVTLQANNDITVNSAITTVKTGAKGGDLTLQAGRSVAINANISTDDGNLAITANERAANGGVDAYRDAGAASITLGSGTSLNSGSGNITLTISDGAGLTNNTAGAMTLHDITTTGILTLNTFGTIGATGTVSSGTFTLASGTWSQIATTLPSFSSTDFRIAGGTFIRAKAGDGSSGSPYQLADIYGVQGMGSSGLLGKSYTLSNDIAATGTTSWNSGAGFVPIGDATTQFTGSFDGLGHTVSNLLINRSSSDNVGMFGWTGAGSAIRNVGLTGGSVSGASYVGGLVGSNNSGTISNSHVTGSVSGSVGRIGGLIGRSYNSALISNSYVTGNVSGPTDVGGLVGFNSLGSTITSSYASGNVSATSNNIGGLVGINRDSGVINNSYATGTVSGSWNVGGLVGQVVNSGSVDASYATGSVSGAGALGGLVGLSLSSSVTNSYWNTQTSSQSGSAGGTGLTNTQMQQISSFTGWNIAKTGGSGATWRIYEGNTYPLLTAFLTPLTLANATDSAVDYNGSAQSGATTSTPGVLGAAATGTNAGFYNGYYSTQQGYDLSGGNLTINPVLVTLSANKAYDGTTDLTGAVTLGNLIGAETLSYSGAVASGTHVAIAGKYISAIILANGTGLARNYILPPLNFANAPATITARPLVATASIGGSTTKVYDGTTVATGATVGGSVTGGIAGDTLSLDLTPVTLAYNGSHVVGTNAIVASGSPALTLGGSNGSVASDYGFTAPTIANAAASVTERPLTVTLGGTSKTYDGTSGVTAMPTATFGNFIPADLPNLTLAGSINGSYDNRHVGTGKAVTYLGLSLTRNATASDYSLPTGATGTGSITQRTTPVAWTGSTTGVWSNPANWGGILPDGDNVTAVTIPTGTTVTFDGTNTAGGFLGYANLNILTSSGNLALTGGTLTIAQSLNSFGYSQTGGSLTGAGSFTVTDNFSKAGGTLTPGGTVTITQNSGNLVFANEAAISVGLLSAPNGNIELDNTGGIATTTLVSAGGHVWFSAHSPIAVGSGGIQAGSGINLFATTTGSNSNISIGGNLITTSGVIGAIAYNGITQAAGTQVSGGSVTLTSTTGSITLDPTASVSVTTGGTILFAAPTGSVSYANGTVTGATPTVTTLAGTTTPTTTSTTTTTSAAQNAATTAVQSTLATNTTTSSTSTSTNASGTTNSTFSTATGTTSTGTTSSTPATTADSTAGTSGTSGATSSTTNVATNDRIATGSGSTGTGSTTSDATLGTDSSQSAGTSSGGTATVATSGTSTAAASSTSAAASGTDTDKPADMTTAQQPTAKPVVQLVAVANATIQKPVEQLVQVERPRGRVLVCR